MADPSKSEGCQRPSINNYHIVGLLAEGIKIQQQGSYAQVYEAIRLSDNIKVAIKKVQKSTIERDDRRREVFIERYVMCLSKLHKGIIGFYGCAQDNEYLYYINELCPYGDLGIRMHDLYETTHLDDTLVRVYIYQMVNILIFLHSQGIAHLDFKPKNLVIAQNYDLRVIDFATCYFFNQIPQQIADQIKKSSRSEATYKQKFVGTANYVSPEMLTNSQASCEADMWALGCIIYELYYGHQPFTDRSDNTIFDNIVNLRFSKIKTINHDVQDLINQLLVIDPSKRLNAASAMKHEFFDQIRHYTPWIDAVPIHFDNIYTQVNAKPSMESVIQNQLQQKIFQRPSREPLRTIYEEVEDACTPTPKYQYQSQKRIKDAPNKHLHKKDISFGCILVPQAGWFCFPKTAVLFAYIIPAQLEIYFLNKNVIIIPINRCMKITSIDSLYIVESQSLIFKFKDMEAKKVDWVSVVKKIKRFIFQ